MKKRLTMMCVLVALVSLGARAAPAQRARRPAKAEDTGPVTVTRSATLRVPISSDAVGIFSYLSEAQKLTLWFPDQAIIEAQLGGKYHFLWKGTEGVWSGYVTEFIKGNTLGYTWQPPDEPNETRVRFKLFPQGAQTIVELSHSGFSSSEEMERAVKAWVFYLRNLKSLIEDGTDLRGQARRAPARTTTRRKR